MKRTALFLVLMLAGCGGSPQPTTPTAPTTTLPPAPANRNPAISRLNVSPTFGIAYLTPFTISALASDPDGDALTYSWAFIDSFRGQVLTATGPDVRLVFSVPWPLGSVIARLTVTDGRGGSAIQDSVAFVVGSMSTDWEVKSPAFPGIIMFYLSLRQDSTGVVAGEITNAAGDILGRTDPAAPGRIDAQGQLTRLRLKFDNGADLTISGQMQPNGFEVLGNFTNTTATFRGIPLNGLPVILHID